MVLRKLKAAFAAGVTVDTVLSHTRATGGGTLHGEVRLVGGKQDHRVQHVTLDVEAIVDNSDAGPRDILRHEAGTTFDMPAHTPIRLPFRLNLPWETPITGIDGEPVPGIRIGMATELALEHAFDKGDLDPLVIEPLPAQAAVLKAASTLGFAFHQATIVPGGLPQSTLPFRQKFEYWPAGEFRRAFRQLKLSFRSTPTGADVHIEVNKYEGETSTGGTTGSHVHIAHDSDQAWDILRAELHRLAERPGMFG